MTGSDRLAEVSRPVLVDGQRTAPGLRFGDPRVHALLACLLAFRLHADGFTSRDLRALVAPARGLPEVSVGSMTHDLRRLRLHGFIRRIPRTYRYQLTEDGLETAVAFTLAHDRVVRPGLAALCDPAIPSQLRTAFTRFADRSCLAA
jgi:hypothetical protein